MNYPVVGVTRVVVKELIFLKHRVFQPQLSAPLETRMSNGILNSIQETVDQQLNVGDNLKILLANSLEANISKGFVTDIMNGWNTSRYSFLLVTEIYDGMTLIAEEILQGYTDSDESTIGNLANGATVMLKDDLSMYVNRIMQITYSTDHNGNRSPRFNRADSVLSDPLSRMSDTGKVLNRPFDFSIAYYTDSITNDIYDEVGYSATATSDASRYNGKGKLSASDNEVAGRMMSKIITSAAMSKTANDHTFHASANRGGAGLAAYENMSGDLGEGNLSNYHTIKNIGTMLGRIRPTNWTLKELSVLSPNTTYKVSTVESYNDSIGRQMNQAFHFNGIDDKGDTSFSDNQITRFQKKIVPYLFDKMLAHGFILFSGKMSNKTVDGSIYLDPNSLLVNVSSTVNGDANLSMHMRRLFISTITDIETKRILAGDNNDMAVELVFDLKLEASIIYVNINGYTSTIRIPSMSDSLSSIMISTERDNKILSTEIKQVVDSTLGLGISNQNQVLNSSIWSN